MGNDSGTIDQSEITIKELIIKIRSWAGYFVGKWKIIFLALIVGAGTGVLKHNLTQKLYSAKSNFILEEGGSNPTGALESLSFMGLGSSNSAKGLFQGKNLVWLYSSRLMLEKVLLSPIDSFANKKYIDWFLQIDKEGKKILESHKALKFDPSNLSLEENGILSFAVGTLKKDYLQVGQAEGTDNVITVTIKAPDESFALSFNKKITDEVNQYYIASKTQKLTNEIKRIQNKVDSFQLKMNNSMFEAASSVDANPNPNPNRQILNVPSRKKGVDVNISSELFIDMMRNLEAKKMALSSETPLIQVLETPILPLETNAKSIFSTALSMSVLFVFLSLLALAAYRIYKLTMQ